MTKDEELVLFRVGTQNLQKHANRKDYMNALWIRKSGIHKGKKYYISKRTREAMWIKWEPFTGSAMRGLSVRVKSLLQFFKDYEVVG